MDLSSHWFVGCKIFFIILFFEETEVWSLNSKNKVSLEYTLGRVILTAYETSFIGFKI